jgi:hypothetical protein
MPHTEEEKTIYFDALCVIARYIVDEAVQKPMNDRDRYLQLAYSEVKRGLVEEVREEIAVRREKKRQE